MRHLPLSALILAAAFTLFPTLGFAAEGVICNVIFLIDIALKYPLAILVCVLAGLLVSRIRGLVLDYRAILKRMLLFFIAGGALIPLVITLVYLLKFLGFRPEGALVGSAILLFLATIFILRERKSGQKWGFYLFKLFTYLISYFCGVLFVLWVTTAIIIFLYSTYYSDINPCYVPVSPSSVQN